VQGIFDFENEHFFRMPPWGGNARITAPLQKPFLKIGLDKIPSWKN
jgi:hypothetical protein